MQFVIRRQVDKFGRVVLPNDLRKHYKIDKGGVVVIVATEEGILLKKPEKTTNN